jgi:hypothetical protein
MILSALGQAYTVLVLSLPSKGLIPFRKSIFHINTSYNLYPGNVEHHKLSFGELVKVFFPPRTI